MFGDTQQLKKLKLLIIEHINLLKMGFFVNVFLALFLIWNVHAQLLKRKNVVKKTPWYSLFLSDMSGRIYSIVRSTLSNEYYPIIDANYSFMVFKSRPSPISTLTGFRPYF